MYLLTIDAGNTHTVFGLWQDKELLSTCRLSTRPESTSWEWKTQLKDWLGDIQLIQSASLATVVPALETPLRACLADFFGCKDVVTIHPKLQFPFTFDYPGRETLGADRLASAAGGVVHYGSDLIIVDFGTAITFCVIIDNVYKGGVIAPGIYTSLEALFLKTARLPHVDFAPPPVLPARTTIESIQAGSWLSCKGMVREILSELKKATNRNMTVIATGGISEDLPFATDFFDITDRNLTLRGLVDLYYRNVGPS